MTDNIYSLTERRARQADKAARIAHERRQRDLVRECIEGIFADSPYRLKGI